MSHHLMFWSSYGVLPFLFVVLLVCSSEIGVVYAQGDLSENIELFTSATKVSPGAQGFNDTDKGDVKVFRSLSLVSMNDLMVGLAIAYYDKVEDADNGVWARHISSEGKDWAAQTTAESGNKWTTQVAIQRRKKTNYTVQLKGPKAVVKENKVFLLLQRDDKPSITQNKAEWDVELYTGDVTAPSEGGGKAIKFGSPTSLKNTVDAYLKTKSWTRPRDATGRGILMKKDNTIVFPLVAVQGEGNNKKHFCTVIYLTDNGKSWKIPSSGFIGGDCVDATLFEWEGKLLMFASRGDEENKLYESSDMGETWVDLSKRRPTVLSEGLQFCICSAQYDIMTITVDDKDMVLFTKQGTYQGQASSNVLHLFLSDNNRVYSVGPISDDYMKAGAFSTLLYTKDELFAMYDKGEKASSTVVLAHLPNQLDQIKTVLKAWKDVDKRILPSSLTNGLVGFLSSKSNAAKWEDEYLGVNATVQGSATKVDYGLKLTLPGTQVVWPIGEQEDDQAYLFTDRGFTVLAMVTIDNKPESVTRLMGLEFINDDSEKEYTWLSYDKDKQWKGVTVDGGSGQPNTWEEGKAYQVALVFQNGTGSVYIDGKLLGSLEDPAVRSDPDADDETLEYDDIIGCAQLQPFQEEEEDADPVVPRVVLRVLIGEEQGDKQEKEGDKRDTSSQVTVRNVMLYTRSLNTSELQMPIIIDTNIGNIGDGFKAIKGDNSMHEHVSRLLFALIGFLGFVSFFVKRNTQCGLLCF